MERFVPKKSGQQISESRLSEMDKWKNYSFSSDFD